MTADNDQENPRQGALYPKGEDGLVVVKNPPTAEMHMSPDEADISGIRLLDAAERARKMPGEREHDHRDEGG